MKIAVQAKLKVDYSRKPYPVYEKTKKQPTEEMTGGTGESLVDI